MLAYRYPLIAREGWLWIAIVFCVAVLLYFFSAQASIPFWVLTLLLIFLFRDPHRKVPALPLGIVCPVDGRVIAIEEVSPIDPPIFPKSRYWFSVSSESNFNADNGVAELKPSTA